MANGSERGPGAAPVTGVYPDYGRRWRQTCEICGDESCVHVLTGYSEQTPLFRNLCLACAERPLEPAEETPAAAGRPRLSAAAAVIVAGVLVGAGGALADQLGVGGSSGFGLAQMIGLAVGGVCIMVGAFLRVDTLGIAGGILFLASAGADLLVGGKGGFGWKQVAAVAMGCALTAAGMAWLFIGRRSERYGEVESRGVPA